MRKTFCYISGLLSVLFFTLFTNGILAQNISAKDIKDPKTLCAACYVSNPDGILTEAAVETINKKLEALFQKTTAQVAVVAIKGDESTSARDLSMELFDLWKPGSKGKDNGLIILLCVEARDVFLRTGYGLEGALPDAATTRIFNSNMAPYFKKGEWDKGLMAGVDAVCDKLYAEYEDNGFAQKEPVDPTPYMQTYILLCTAYLLIAIFAINSKVSKIDACNKKERISVLKKSSTLWLILGIFFMPALLLLALWVYRIKSPRIRKAKIKCDCGNMMKRLSENEEDEYLDTVKQLEEKIGSVNYDVWLCSKCHNTMVFQYDKALSKYETCPSCSAKTYTKKYDTVIRPATSLRDGLMKTVYKCENCGYSGEKTSVIPKKPPVIVTGGFGGGGNSGGFSGGGSWGGGFSGGGGGGGKF